MDTPNYADLEARLKAAVEEVEVHFSVLESESNHWKSIDVAVSSYLATKASVARDVLNILSRHGLTGENDD